MRLFLDANVLFAACWSPEGTASLLVRVAVARPRRQLQIVTSAHALEEARRNLALKRPEALPALDAIEDPIDVVGAPSPELVAWAMDEHSLPIGDAAILAAAAVCRADALVTGDATHFGRLYDTRCRGVVVRRPRDALSLVLGT